MVPWAAGRPARIGFLFVSSRSFPGTLGTINVNRNAVKRIGFLAAAAVVWAALPLVIATELSQGVGDRTAPTGRVCRRVIGMSVTRLSSGGGRRRLIAGMGRMGGVLRLPPTERGFGPFLLCGSARYGSSRLLGGGGRGIGPSLCVGRLALRIGPHLLEGMPGIALRL